MDAPRLRSLPFAARLGMTALLAVFALGLWASAEYIRIKHENRDREPGVSMLDIVGAYHGVQAPSRLRATIERGHPEGLSPAARSALVAWLSSDTAAISRMYDDLDLGDLAPSELLAAECLSCHARATAAEQGAGVVLDTWESVGRIAFPIDIAPLPYEILVGSTHAHALVLAAIGVVFALLLWFSRWPRRLVGFAVCAVGVGLLLDIGGWWGARHDARLAYAIVVGGALFNLGAALALLLTLLELWLPRRDPAR